MGTFARDCFLPRAAVPNALSDLRHRNTTPHPCAKNFFKFPAAVLRTLRLSDGDQPVGCEGEGAVDDVVHLAPRGAEEVVRLPVRLGAGRVGFDTAERELPVLGRAGLFGGGAQHAPHAADLVAALQGKGLVVERGVGRIAGGHGGVVKLRKRGVEALQGLGVGVHGVSSSRAPMQPRSLLVVCPLGRRPVPCGAVRSHRVRSPPMRRRLMSSSPSSTWMPCAYPCCTICSKRFHCSMPTRSIGGLKYRSVSCCDWRWRDMLYRMVTCMR